MRAAERCVACPSNRARALGVMLTLLVGACVGSAPNTSSDLAPPPATAIAPSVVPAPALIPSAPHELLTFFEGTWTIEEVPPEREFRETCAWLAGGRRHMVCRNYLRRPTGDVREGMSMFSYRAADSTYLYYGLGPGGSTESLLGRPTDDGWRFWGERGTGPERTRVLVTITLLPGRRFRFIEQTATGSAAFSPGDTIHYRPSVPQP